MELSFEGRGLQFRGEAEPAERSDKDKHHPWSVRLTANGPGADGQAIEGRLQVTDLAVEEASARASDGAAADGLLADAFCQSFVAELGLRPLRSGFDFIIDHRWVTGTGAGRPS